MSLLPDRSRSIHASRRPFASAPVSHRSPAFIETYERVREQLRAFAAGMDVVLFREPGTLANDAVAANLKAIFGDAEGVVLANGEFGARLVRQARARGCVANLAFPYGSRGVRSRGGCAGWRRAMGLGRAPGDQHRRIERCGGLQRVAGRAGCAVALDCVSSIGATPIPADRDYLLLASGVSGKSFGAYAGLAMVYMSDACRGLLKDKDLSIVRFACVCGRRAGRFDDFVALAVCAGPCAGRQLWKHAGNDARRFAEYRCLGERVREDCVLPGCSCWRRRWLQRRISRPSICPMRAFRKSVRVPVTRSRMNLHTCSRGLGTDRDDGRIREETLARFFETIRALEPARDARVPAAAHVH